MDPYPSPSTSRHVCVLGAGIAGLATAWQLQREGHSVTVIDSARSGAGASAANGAQLSYAYVQPLADPAIWRQLPKLLLAPDSPLKMRLQWDPAQWAWGLRFLAACRARVSRRSTAQLLQLAAESRAGFETWLAQAGIDCDFSATGKLVIYSDEAGFAGARRQLALQRSLGVEQQALSPAECVAVEPALASAAAKLVGGIHTPSECAADCLKVCLGLEAQLRARGARFLFDTTAQGLQHQDGRITAVRTQAGEVHADAFVVALGTGSRRLAAPLGLDLPVYPLKGYSITLPCPEDPGQAPRVNVTDAARKVVFARIGQRLRVAGMAELVGHDHHIEPTRIASLRQSTQALFPDLDASGDMQPWTGLRPATPTGVPIVGRLRGAPDNLLFNTGHGALGFTLAFGSARRVAAALAQRAETNPQQERVRAL